MDPKAINSEKTYKNEEVWTQTYSTVPYIAANYEAVNDTITGPEPAGLWQYTNPSCYQQPDPVAVRGDSDPTKRVEENAKQHSLGYAFTW